MFEPAGGDSVTVAWLRRYMWWELDVGPANQIATGSAVIEVVSIQAAATRDGQPTRPCRIPTHGTNRDGVSMRQVEMSTTLQRRMDGMGSPNAAPLLRSTARIEPSVLRFFRQTNPTGANHMNIPTETATVDDIISKHVDDLRRLIENLEERAAAADEAAKEQTHRASSIRSQLVPLREVLELLEESGLGCAF